MSDDDVVAVRLTRADAEALRSEMVLLGADCAIGMADLPHTAKDRREALEARRQRARRVREAAVIALYGVGE